MQSAPLGPLHVHPCAPDVIAFSLDLGDRIELDGGRVLQPFQAVIERGDEGRVVNRSIT
jgi:hypothetical protein